MTLPGRFRVWDLKAMRFLRPDVCMIDGDGKLFTLHPPKGKLIGLEWIEALPGKYEISWSTGLFDKNGREIFEGHLVRFKQKWADGKIREYERLIVWDSVFGRFSTAQEGDEDGEYLEEGTDMEIFGDIFEHPELLNQPEGK